MGHLLGAAPAFAHDGLMPRSVVRRTQRVTEIFPSTDVNAHLAGFAIDVPQTGGRYAGDGVEINGWVIGQGRPVASVVATVNGAIEVRAPLDVQRPDVMPDYPVFPWAALSGFSFWVPIPPDASTWSVEVESILADESRIALAKLSGQHDDEMLTSCAGLRPVTAPDYVILGTQRGGTTSLFRYLEAHPNVCNPATKELHFLTDRYSRGRAWYVGQLPGTLRPDEITGEATPYALFHPQAPYRARQIAPRAKFIILLRDPVDRALSHFHHERALGVETLSFADAISAESSRLAGEFENLSSKPDYVSFNHKHFSYLARGDYASQISRWLDVFPPDQFLMLKSEDLYLDPQATMRRVLEFLGLQPVELGRFDVHNRSFDAEWDESLRAQLRDHFAPMNRKLSRFIGWTHLWP